MSNAVFRRKVAAFARQVEENSERAVRSIGLSVLRSVVEMSPVDTGRFKGNWHVQFDANPVSDEAVDRQGNQTISRGARELGKVTAETPKVYILNHLPYAIALEYGHSKQAPTGMVRRTVARLNEFLSAVKKELR